MSAPPAGPPHTEVSDAAALPPRPLVSVLTVAYNQAGYLPQAIEGALAPRTDFPFESLWGDDCSQDATRALMLDSQRRHPERIRVIFSERNVGPHRNLRRLVEASRGELLAACDGDDYWVAPDKLQRQVDVLRARPGVSAVFGNFAIDRWVNGAWRVDAEDAVPRSDIAALRGKPRGRSLAGRLRTLTSVYRRSIYTGLYASDLPLEQYPFLDSFLVAQALRTGEVEFLPERVAVYRESPQSITRSTPAGNLKVLEGLREFLGRFHHFFPELGPIDAAETHALDQTLCRAAYIAGAPEAYEADYRRLQATGLPIPLLLTVLRRAVEVPALRRFSVWLRSRAWR